MPPSRLRHELGEHYVIGQAQIALQLVAVIPADSYRGPTRATHQMILVSFASGSSMPTRELDQPLGIEGNGRRLEACGSLIDKMLSMRPGLLR